MYLNQKMGLSAFADEDMPNYEPPWWNDYEPPWWYDYQTDPVNADNPPNSGPTNSTNSTGSGFWSDFWRTTFKAALPIGTAALGQQILGPNQAWQIDPLTHLPALNPKTGLPIILDTRTNLPVAAAGSLASMTPLLLAAAGVLVLVLVLKKK